MDILFYWFQMGGYADYVWSAYGIVFTVFATHFFYVKQQKKRVFNQLKQWVKSL